MLDQQIHELRNELNHMMIEEVDYDEVYAVSIELDKLITEYYHQQQRDEQRQELKDLSRSL